MAQKIIVYWRDIPAQVIVKKGRKSAKRELPDIFIKAIDKCAMTDGAKDSEAYLADWRRAAPVDVSDDLDQEAATACDALVEAYPSSRLALLVSHKGYEQKD
ncbi:MAG: virulence factor [Cohaesibacter sp.]|nr:virulence factor [Cohaesibacter sp.]MCV6602351.1 virulence factor [Cohaesibacter sp.]